MAKRERGEGKKIVLVVRFRERRVSCIYNRPTKKKKKSICYTFCRFSTTCNRRANERKQNKDDMFD